MQNGQGIDFRQLAFQFSLYLEDYCNKNLTKLRVYSQASSCVKMLNANISTLTWGVSLCLTIIKLMAMYSILVDEVLSNTQMSTLWWC